MFATFAENTTPSQTGTHRKNQIQQSIKDYAEDHKIRIHGTAEDAPDRLSKIISKYAKALTTYYTNNGTVQCSANRRRSIEDLYWLLCSYGFQNQITLNNCIAIMEQLTVRGHYTRSYCGTVVRWVYSRTGYGANITDVQAALQHLNIIDAALGSQDVAETPIEGKLLELTEQFNKLPDIRIRGLLKKRKETMKEFVIKLFTKWNQNRETIYVETKQVQTVPGKRRSLADIYKICKYYYPKCNLKQVRNLLYSSLHDEIPKFRSSYCNTINKRVWYVGAASQGSGVYDKTQNDEFGLQWDQWLTLE